MRCPDVPVAFYRFRPGKWEAVEARVIVETPVALNVNGEAWLSFSCTPTLLNELAAGFLYNERVIETRADIAAIDLCAQGDSLDVWLHRTVTKPAAWQRTSGCSGGVTAAAPEKTPLPLPAGQVDFLPDLVLELVDQFNAVQHLYRRARGVHSSALANQSGLLAVAEDIGRHNTLDKLAGILLFDPPAQPASFLLTTGRVSSEMLQKAARMRCPTVISRTAPNSLSIRQAEELGITLIGYARRAEFNVYAHPERLAHSLPAPAVPLPATLPECSH